MKPDLGLGRDIWAVAWVDSAGRSSRQLPGNLGVRTPPASVDALVRIRAGGGPTETRAGRYLTRFQRVDPGFLALMGRRPFLGQDARRPGEVVLSHAFWTATLGGASDILGEDWTVDGAPSVVVGVAPPDFDGPLCCVRPDFWVADGEGEAGGFQYLLVGVRDTAAAAASLTAAVRRDYPFVRAAQVAPVDEAVFGGESGVVGRILTILLALAAMAYAGTVTNGANLLAADTLDRARELRLRLALGSPRRALLLLLSTEALCLAVAAGVVGLAGAYVLLRVAPFLLPIIGRGSVLDVDIGEAVFLTVVWGVPASAILCALPGMAVAWGGGRRGLADRRAEKSRVGTLLLGTQIALATALVIVTGVFLDTVRTLDGDFVGFRRGDAQVFTVGSAGDRPVQPEEALARARGVAGVQSAALTRWLPVYGAPQDSVVLAAGAREVASMEQVSEGYFDVTGLRIQNGRAPVDATEAVVSPELGRRAGGVGATIEVAGAAVRIVGVTEAATWGTGRERATVYRGWPAASPPVGTLLVVPAPGERPTLGQLVQAVTPLGMAMSAFGTLDDLLTRSRVLDVLLARLASLFGTLCVIVGLVGVHAHFVRWVKVRERDMGIRYALGARPARLRGQVYRAALYPLMGGIGGGVLAVLTTFALLGRVLRYPPPTASGYAIAVGVVLVLALATLVGPAIRVAGRDPVSLLRSE